ncbi:substrate-binding domain-containing protein [Cohnella thailandensis]|uniref:Substrate-binding domain-containing protein n=1 Tax=Cohnella thailandensis TaxID=557557 RepID=A0A841T2H1_9BACL|nr:substrate-binding domain-containing protein [Cohnella thailandensis]MBB6636805.1 substrate-binding domain-containing protein [Cohnella thailandensis]MBP1973318.1 ribose transport system substrate-binding protein [Cohnella thailandensis]
MNRSYGNAVRLALAAAAAVLLYLALFGEAPVRQTKQEEIRVQMIVRSSQSDYWHTVSLGAEAAAREFGISLNQVAPSSEGDAGGQLRQAEEALLSKPDAIVLAANEDAAFGPFLTDAEKKRIPVIAIDSLLTSGKTETYIGIDNELAGREAVRQLNALLGEKGNIGLLAYANGGINGKLREAGARKAAQQAAGLKLVDFRTCGEGDCEQAAGELLDENRLDGLVALNATASEGAARELKRRGIAGGVKLVGFDSSPELLELLQEGYIQKLVVQNPFSMGYLGVKQAIEAASGRRLPERTEMDTAIIDKDNLFWMKNQKLLFPVVQ